MSFRSLDRRSCFVRLGPFQIQNLIMLRCLHTTNYTLHVGVTVVLVVRGFVVLSWRFGSAQDSRIASW